jgi:peptide/nickel transport system substrate-binding protein
MTTSLRIFSGNTSASLPASLALPVAFGLAACSPAPATGIDSGAASTANLPPAVSVEADSRPLAYPLSDYHAPASATPRPGGTLRVSAAADPGTLDFQLITHTNAKWVGRLLYDNLVYLDEKGDYVPWLATSWTISPDGLTYVFKLREGVTFSDGTPFDAEAVRVNLDRMRDPATRTGMTTAYLAPYRDGVVLDKYTFQANLSRPYTAFLNVLAQSWLGLSSPQALRENPKALAERPVGSGPFVVESYQRQEHIRLVRRPDYDWAPPFVRHTGPAFLDRIEISFVSEALVRYSSLAAGYYDLTLDVPPQNAAGLRAHPDFVVHSRVNLGNPVRAISFNVEAPPFDDVRVRRAFALAVDRVGLERISGFGEYRLKTDFLSATTRHYDPSFQDALRHDPAAAARLLDEAGWTGRAADGIRLHADDGRRLSAEILTTESATPSANIVAIQSDLRRLGFELNIVQLPAAQATERRRAGTYQATGSGFWHTNTPDGLFIVYHGDQVSPGFIGQNTARLRDPIIDDLLSRARHATDPSLLPGLYSAAQARLVELVPAVPVYENHTLIAHHRRLRGVFFDTSHNTPWLLSAWLDPHLR